MEVVHALEVQAVLLRHVQGSSDAERDVGRNGWPRTEYIVDPAGRDGGGPRLGKRSDLEFVEDLWEMFSGVERVAARGWSSMVVRDFDLSGARSVERKLMRTGR